MVGICDHSADAKCVAFWSGLTADAMVGMVIFIVAHPTKPPKGLSSAHDACGQSQAKAPDPSGF
jgi:hypothetical protein